tara:strand:+ start:6780 stop:7892 length:1113 start_codon:yes stop_codon:yes gene_type:complete
MVNVICTVNGQERVRARDLGVEIGMFRPGPFNSITDVEGVKVGHSTLIRGDSVRTGVTVIHPHGGNLFLEKVPAAVYVTNGFGKLVGTTQIEELGTIETPIALTNTLNTFLVANALIDYMIKSSGPLRSVNPIVGETNDSGLNDIQGRHIQKEHLFEAIKNSHSGPIEEGSVGAGTGTQALGFKGGIGTASRILPKLQGGYKVGVLVQSNFGGLLTIDGVPVGKEMGKVPFRKDLSIEDEGSCMIVIATNAPLSPRNLKRIAKRTSHAFGRVGAYSSNGSGDYAIAFSTAPEVRRNAMISAGKEFTLREVKNNEMSPLFQAVIESTEEAIINSIMMATSIESRFGRSEALPINETVIILKKYGVINDVSN